MPLVVLRSGCQGTGMHALLADLVTRRQGVVSRAQALRVVSARCLEHAVARGYLIRMHPRVYVDPALRIDWRTRCRAALRYAGPGAVLSHTSALAFWGVTEPDESRVHVTTTGRRLRAPNVVVHRRPNADVSVRHRQGFRMTDINQSIVDSWRLLPIRSRRISVIKAVAVRLTTAERLRAVVAATSNLPGRQELLRLTGLLAAGCHSWLELWGYERVLTGPELGHLRRQVPVRLGRRTIYLDTFAEAEQVDFELDGHSWHSAKPDRERDLRRDAALATLGITVVRFSHDRLLSEPEAVRAEAIAILRARRTSAR